MNQRDAVFRALFNEATGGLGKTPVPTGTYIPCAVGAGIAYSAGQIAVVGDQVLFPGKVGRDVDADQAYQAARVACLNCLSGILEALGSLEKVKKVLKVTGYVCCTEDFDRLPYVMNGASDVLVQIFGDAGKHPRSTIGVGRLAFGASVEVELVCEVEV